MIKNTSWYQAERPIGEVSLGGLIILVFVRTIQLNTLKTRVSSPWFFCFLSSVCVLVFSYLGITTECMVPRTEDEAFFGEGREGMRRVYRFGLLYSVFVIELIKTISCFLI